MAANKKQIGGTHYKTEPGVPEHWDLAIMYQWDPFQYQITKYVMRWKEKDGLEDLEKAQHFLEKYIENYHKYSPEFTRTKEPALPRYEQIKEMEEQFTFEGVKGDGTALYKCKRCKTEVWADNPITAFRLHGECASKAYVDQG